MRRTKTTERWARRTRRLTAAVVAGLLLVISPASMGVARAQDASLAYEGSVGLASAVSSLVYGPAKVLYAAGGLALSATTLIWTFGDTDVAGPLFTQTVGGDYVVTPSHITGDRELNFFGS